MSLEPHLVLRVALILQSWGILVHPQLIRRRSRTQWHAPFGRLTYIPFIILVLLDVLGWEVRTWSWVSFMSSTSSLRNTSWMGCPGSHLRFLSFCRFWAAQRHRKISFQKGRSMRCLQTKSFRSPYLGREKVTWVPSILFIMYHLHTYPCQHPFHLHGVRVSRWWVILYSSD